MKSPFQLLANADIDHLETVATAFSSQIGMRLCSQSIGSHNLFPRLHEVLYTHFKNIQNFTIHSRLSVQLSADAYVYSLPERASQLMWTARCLAASAKRWPQHADFDLDDLRGLFERGQELGGSIGQAATWAEVVSALEALEMATTPSGPESEVPNPPAHEIDWKTKRKQVRSIEQAALRHRASPGKGPRDAVAVVLAMIVLFMGLIAPVGLSRLGLVLSLPWGPLLAVLAALCSYFAVFALGPVSRSYSDILFTRLAAYAPVDKKAYRTLQGRTGKYGYIESHDLEDWASSERLAISEAAGFMKAKDAFVGKAV